MLRYLSLDIISVFLESHSFPQATLLENCWLFRTDVHAQISELIIHQIFSLMCDTCRSKHVTWQNIPQLKLENIQEYSPSFKAAHVAEKICRMLNTISLHFGQKYARIFVLGLSVPRSSQFSSSYALRKLFA